MWNSSELNTTHRNWKIFPFWIENALLHYTKYIHTAYGIRHTPSHTKRKSWKLKETRNRRKRNSYLNWKMYESWIEWYVFLSIHKLCINISTTTVAAMQYKHKNEWKSFQLIKYIGRTLSFVPLRMKHSVIWADAFVFSKNLHWSSVNEVIIRKIDVNLHGRVWVCVLCNNWVFRWSNINTFTMQYKLYLS